MSCPFKVSDKVVCVDASPHVLVGDLMPRLTSGAVYCVRALSDEGKHGLLSLVGDPVVPNYASRSGFPHAWGAHRFRLLAEAQAENSARQAQEAIT